jgi:hypothetical protein
MAGHAAELASMPILSALSGYEALARPTAGEVEVALRATTEET